MIKLHLKEEKIILKYKCQIIIAINAKNLLIVL